MYSEITAIPEDQLVERYCTLVKRIAHHLAGRLPASVQPDDLIQAGMIGLLEASKNYDPSKGASFETYAGIRIRGSMLDEIRKGDWVPRSVHRNARRVAEVVRQLEHRMGSEVRDTDVAEALGLTIPEYHHMLKDVSGCRMIGYDDLGVSEEMLSKGMSSQLPDPYSGLHEDNFKAHLTENISNLPERERLVLTLYYDEELNLREIGEVLGVSESRVCQIHGQAMLRLQSLMSEWTELE